MKVYTKQKQTHRYRKQNQMELAKAEKMLQDATENVRGLVKDIEAGTYSTETGVKANDMIGRWLDQVLLLEKTKAELGAQDVMRQKLDQQLLYFAPIGATIARKTVILVLLKAIIWRCCEHLMPLVFARKICR